MLDGLGVNLTAAHVFDSQRQPLSVLDLSITHGLQVGLLNFTVFGPDDFPVSVHRHGRLLPTHLHSRGRRSRKMGREGKEILVLDNDTFHSESFFTIKMNITAVSSAHLDNDAAFVVAQRHIVGAPEAAHTPHSLHAIVQSALQAVSA